MIQECCTSQSNKRWWRLNRQLLQTKTTTNISSISVLKHNAAKLSNTLDEANFFDSFSAAKASLADEAVDWPFLGTADYEFDRFNFVCSKYARGLLRTLGASKTTEHDEISAAILNQNGNDVADLFFSPDLQKTASWNGLTTCIEISLDLP